MSRALGWMFQLSAAQVPVFRWWTGQIIRVQNWVFLCQESQMVLGSEHPALSHPQKNERILYPQRVTSPEAPLREPP